MTTIFHDVLPNETAKAVDILNIIINQEENIC